MEDCRDVFDKDACGDVVLAVLLEDVEGGLLVVVGLDCAEIPPLSGLRSVACWVIRVR